MPKIIGIGINVVDIYRHQGKMYPGGNEYNISYHANKLGANAAFMGVFANDVVGTILSDLFKKEGIDISHSRYEEGSSGYAIVDLINGDRVFVDWNKQGVTDLYPIEMNDDELEYIKGFDIACIGSSSRLTIPKITKLEKTGIQLSYDFSDTFTKEIVEQLCPLMEFSFFSCDHIPDKEVIRDLLREAVKLGSKKGIATMGERGVIAFDGFQFYEQASILVKATDTMGAGDSFIAAFLTKYLSNLETDKYANLSDNMKNSLYEGVKLAAKVVTQDGALGVGYPVDINKLDEIINL